MRDLLQGRPIRHPLHPMLVHLPIGLFFLALLFDVFSWIVGDSTWLVRGSFYALIVGIIGALIASIPGFADYQGIRPDHPGHRIAWWHMVLNLAAVVIFILSVLLRWGKLDLTQAAFWPFALLLLGNILVMFSGYLGGSLIYNDGIAVGRHRHAGPLPRETIHLRSADAADGYLAIADDADLKEGHTLRVTLDARDGSEGQVMAIARVGGELCAFQEFCTHRFGPLSEGHFENGQVMCPWHRSCFDIHTGEATQGPAKVKLKTWKVQVRNGKICLEV